MRQDKEGGGISISANQTSNKPCTDLFSIKLDRAGHREQDERGTRSQHQGLKAHHVVSAFGTAQPQHLGSCRQLGMSDSVIFAALPFSSILVMLTALPLSSHPA